MKRTPLLVVATVLLLAACQPASNGGSSVSSAGTTMSVEGWQTITNAAGKYSLQVPADWTGEMMTSDQFVASYGGDDDMARVYVADAEGAVNIGEYLQKLDTLRATGFEGQPSTEVRGTKRVSIDGTPGAERREYGLASGFEMEVTYVLKDGKVYVLSTWHEGNETLTEDDIALHEKIAGTMTVGGGE